MSNKQRPETLTVATQNILLDKTGTKNNEVYAQDRRVGAMASSLTQLGLQLDVVGIQEAYKSKDQHNGEVLAELLGHGNGFWELHNESRLPGSKNGRKNEYIGLFGSRVDHAKPIDLGDNRKALLTTIGGVAFMTFHWRAGIAPRAVSSRRTSAERVLRATNDYEDVVLLGDFNEPPYMRTSLGRRALETSEFVSVFSMLGERHPVTFPTEAYRGVTGPGHTKWSIDDIAVRGKRIHVLGAGTISQIAMEDQQDVYDRPTDPSDHYGLWAQLSIDPET